MKASEFKPKQQEHDIQVACVNWFRYRYPKFLIWAIPNGGQRNKIVAKKLKDEGVLAGVPDLHIPVAMKGYHGLYIEMKAGRNKPSDEQLTIMGKLQNEGYKCVVCWSLDEFMKVVEDYMK
ncbi:MAG: hypothetical protein BGO29_14910 [Bacteroidales bacterium 36-12]|nr:MAG: hypothetical protein BGO29_14910 [Bacteroidales bacterium 36-12]